MRVFVFDKDILIDELAVIPYRNQYKDSCFIYIVTSFTRSWCRIDMKCVLEADVPKIYRAISLLLL